MRVRQSLIQDPAEQEIRTRHRLVNIVTLSAMSLGFALLVLDNGISLTLFLFPFLLVSVLGLLTPENVAFGFGYLSPLARGVFVFSLLGLLLAVIVVRPPLDIPAVQSHSFLLGFTLGGLLAQILWMVD